MTAPRPGRIQIDFGEIHGNFSSELKILQTNREGYDALASWLKDIAGIHLPPTEKNLSLMASRMIPLLRKRGLANYHDYLPLLHSGSTEIRNEFLCQLTTNTTEFFRESAHFDHLREMLPKLISQRTHSNRQDLRVWCAACSTGQEAYSIATTILEAMPAGRLWQLKMLATDIDLKVLQKASIGYYTQDEAKGLPPMIRSKYFTAAKTTKNHGVLANPQLRDMIQFAPFNLMSEPYPFRHPFDIVFCRNVLIYFDRVTAADVIEKLASALDLGGCLFLGHSEAGLSKSTCLTSQATALYRKTSVRKRVR